MKHITYLLLISLVILSCTDEKQSNTIKEYGYRHLSGVTGLNKQIICYDDTTYIQFSEESDSVAVIALKNLDWNILYPNANGKEIILYGILSDDVKKTPSGKNLPESQKYKEFELVHWRIKTPFIYQYYDEPIKILPVELKQTTKKSLAEAGYETFKYRDSTHSYKEYEKAPKKLEKH